MPLTRLPATDSSMRRNIVLECANFTYNNLEFHYNHSVIEDNLIYARFISTEIFLTYEIRTKETFDFKYCN